MRGEFRVAHVRSEAETMTMRRIGSFPAVTEWSSGVLFAMLAGL